MEKDRYFGISGRIAKWKEPTNFEEKLADAAEHSWKARQLYIYFYRQLDEEYYEKDKLYALNLIKGNHDMSDNVDFDEI